MIILHTVQYVKFYFIGETMKRTLLLPFIATLLLTTTTVTAEDDLDLSPEELAALEHDMGNMNGREEEPEETNTSKHVEPKLQLKLGQYAYVNQVTGMVESVDTVDIIVKNDKLKIEKVTANHGNCQLNSSRVSQYPKVYHYGDKIGNSFVKVVNNRAHKCNVLSVEVTTEGGVTSTYEFDR